MEHKSLQNTDTFKSFLSFIGNTPFQENDRFFTLMEDLEKQGVTWVTRLNEPPHYPDDAALLSGRNILSLGSLEGNLEWDMAMKGARKVVGVEGYAANYQKCQLLSTIFPTLPIEFLNADVMEMEVTAEFDIIMCFGVLYHLHEPQLLLKIVRDLRPRQFFIGTQLAVDSDHPAFAAMRLGAAAEITVRDKAYRGRWWSDSRLHHRDYKCGLEVRPSFWFYPDELRRLLEDMQFSVDGWSLQDGGENGLVGAFAVSVPEVPSLMSELSAAS